MSAGELTTATDPADLERLLGLLGALGCHGDAVVLTSPGQPIPKARPRLGRAGTHSTDRQVIAETALGTLLRAAFPAPLTGNVALAAIFHRRDRRVVDGDNLDKLLRDAGNQIAWADDSQITGSAQIVELDRERPRTAIAIAPHTSELTR